MSLLSERQRERDSARDRVRDSVRDSARDSTKDNAKDNVKRAPGKIREGQCERDSMRGTAQ